MTMVDHSTIRVRAVVICLVFSFGLNEDVPGQIVQRLEPDNPSTHFYRSVALCNDVLVVGAEGRDGVSGYAEVFRHDSGVWTSQQKLPVVHPTAVAVSHHFLATAEPDVDLYRYEEGAWSLSRTLSTAKSNVTLSLADSVMVVGQYDKDMVSVYRLTSSGTWGDEQTITLQHSDPYSHLFGEWVSIGDEVILVATPDSAYLFRYDRSSWRLEATLEGGYGGAIAGDVAAVPRSFCFVDMYRYDEIDQEWYLEQTLAGADCSGDGWSPTTLFGESVAFDGETVIIGAPVAPLPEASVGATGKGQVFDSAQILRYSRLSRQWERFLILTPPVTAEGEMTRFGQYVAIDGDIVAVGDSRAGVIYVYSGLATSLEGGPPFTSEPGLFPNYPNPFNPATTISYALPQAADVTLTVVDLLGRTVRELASGTKPAGTYEVSFDATGLPSGVYFCRLQAGDYVETRRMVVDLMPNLLLQFGILFHTRRRLER